MLFLSVSVVCILMFIFMQPVPSEPVPLFSVVYTLLASVFIFTVVFQLEHGFRRHALSTQRERNVCVDDNYIFLHPQYA